MDKYQGHGGTYLLDPKTGKRKLIKRTEPATHPETATEELSNGIADEEAPDSGR